MTTVDIRLVDPADAAAVGALLELKTAVWAHDNPDDVPPTLFNVQMALTTTWPGQVREHYVAVLDGKVVGDLNLEFSTLENLQNAWARGAVHPEFRRRGIGRRLWAFANRRAAERDRTRIGAVSCESVEGGVPRGDHGTRFLAAMGLEPKLSEARRRVDFSTVDWSAMEKLLAEAWKHAAGYRVRKWIDRAPDDLVDGLAYLDGRLLQDAPMGELDIEAPKVDAERFRAAEATADKRRLTRFHVAVQHEETGVVAAWSMIDFGFEHKDRGFQGITIVDPDHRGKRLGTVAKLELHDHLRASAPELTTVDTWNAVGNGYMISINEQIGYRLVDAWADYQGEVTP